ncbi:MAG: radical SAM protein [Candidatus Omnitrophota bacterium]|jgi:radical SAM superfamily enzyme YgiQ (UPF0313 family)|nr:MAG: radical SAM protein [Candidatus Omnitrophota bacterium]
MGKRALLFNPWITDFAAFDHWTRPLNLLRLAALLRHCGLQVDFYDCLNRRSPSLAGLRISNHRLNPFGCGHYYRDTIPTPAILEWIPRAYKRYGIPADRVENTVMQYEPPDVIIIPCMMTYWYLGVFEAIRMMRRLFPKARIILGGTYATLCREHAQAFSGADAVVAGSHWPEIVNQILEMIQFQGNRCTGDQSTWIEPAYDLLPGETCLPLLTTSGCPCHCTYCATHALWPKFVLYDWKRAADSIERAVNECGARDLAFYDDALLVKKEHHFTPLMQEIIRRGISVRFHTPNALHVRQIDFATAILFKQAGFTTVRLGLEVVQEDWQRKTGAKVYTHEYLEAMHNLRNAGFTAREIGTYLLLGLPHQSLEAVWEACEIVVNAGSEIKLAMYSPIPGTPLYQAWQPDFRFDHRSDPLYHNNSLSPFRSRSLEHEKYSQLKRFVADSNHELRTKSVKTACL